MKTSFFKSQSTWVGIMLAGLVVIIVGVYLGGYRFKAENYLPLLKNNDYRDTLTRLNLGFENVSNLNGLPDGWLRWGHWSYDIRVDSLVKRSGKYALRIMSTREPAARVFGCPAFGIPAIFEG